MKKRIYSCIKKGISMGIAAMLSVALISCGNKEAGKASEDPNAATTDEYVYVPEFHKMDVEEETSINRLMIKGEALYYTTYTYNESTQQSEEAFVRRSLDTLESAETLNLSVDIPEGFTSSMGEFVFDKEDNLYCIKHVSPVYVEGKEYEESDYKTYLVKYSADLQEVWSVDLAEVFTEENRYVQSMIAGGEDKIYLSSNNVIYVMDGSGALVKTITVNTDWINSLTATSDGRVFVVQYGNTGMELVEVDKGCDG